MNRSTSTYCQTNFNTTTAGAIAPLVFTDEEKASGFFDSKSLRKQICRTLLASNTPIASSGFLDSKAQRKCLFSGFVFTGKERDEETGYGYFGARYMDHELTTTWLSVDPMADKYPSISPYAYCAWNPVKLVDPDGEEISTHTDELGNVIAVYDDGDNGVYMHKGDAQAHVKKHYNADNTSAGGQYMGESLHSLSFADQNLYNTTGEVIAQQGITIDYGSSELTVFADMIMNQEPSLLQYERNAGTGGDWDIKAHVSHGSKLYGKYASPRDAGNFAAGMVAASHGSAMEAVTQFGYGAYNLSGNDKLKTAVLVFFTGLELGVNPLGGAMLVNCIMNGEDKLSQRCIDLGKSYQRNKIKK